MNAYNIITVISHSDNVKIINRLKEALPESETRCCGPHELPALSRTFPPDIILLHETHCGTTKQLMALIESIRGCCGNIPVIATLEHPSVFSVISAFRAGITDMVLNISSVRELRERILFQLKDEGAPGACRWQSRIVGESLAVRNMRKELRKLARSDSTILITGESGTGKELAADMIHALSPRSTKRFVKINCTAIPSNLMEAEMFGHEEGAFTGATKTRRGKFEMAHNGTILLDEIGDLDLAMQTKLLRAIENQEIYRIGGDRPILFNTRIIASTNRDPARLVREEKMRPDLFYRLNVGRIHLPPLRRRREDIPLLTEHFISEFNSRFKKEVTGLTSRTMAALMRHEWPGNIRELKNVIERIFIFLPENFRGRAEMPENIAATIGQPSHQGTDERRQYVQALMASGWNKTKAARLLKCSRMTIYRKMAQHNIVEKRYPPR